MIWLWLCARHCSKCDMSPCSYSLPSHPVKQVPLIVPYSRGGKWSSEKRQNFPKESGYRPCSFCWVVLPLWPWAGRGPWGLGPPHRCWRGCTGPLHRIRAVGVSSNSIGLLWEFSGMMSHNPCHPMLDTWWILRAECHSHLPFLIQSPGSQVW